MEITITSVEIWQLAVIKLLLFAFIFLGVLFFVKKYKKPQILIWATSIFLSLTYLVIIHRSHVLWWGLQGDEIFVTAFLQKVAAGNLFSDFFYSNLPAFYPPLYFWATGLIAGFLKFDGVQAAQLGVLAVLFVCPLVIYYWQKKYYGKNFSSSKIILSTLALFIVLDWSAIILKPYEFISAALAVFWIMFLLKDLESEKLNLQKSIFYGISGGIIFLTFYFWFFPIIISIVLYKLISHLDFKNYYSKLVLPFLILTLVALPYLLPLLISYAKFGTENWQPAFFVPEDFDLYLPFLHFSIFGLVSAIGLISIIYFWRKTEFKILGTTLLSLYVWQAISFFTTIISHNPFEPNKGFIFFGGAIFCVAAGYGISEYFNENKIRDDRKRVLFLVIAWIIFSTQLLGGSYLDKPDVRNRLVDMKQPIREEYVNLISELKKIEDLQDLTILSSGTGQISAYLPLDYYISYNIHFSHPAANFSQRYNFIKTLSLSIDPKDFYNKIKKSPFEEVDALLLYKYGNSYPFLFWVEEYPLGGREAQIDISASLIDEQYFDKLFEDRHFVFYKIK